MTDLRNCRMGAPGCDDTRRSQDEVRIIKEMTSQEVELFMQANQIDTAAARELRSEPPWVAWAVLERGPLRACTNPSGALVARIRDAKRGQLGGARFGSAGPSAQALPPNASEIDKFLAENRIDQAGMASLRTETLDIQKAVMSKGPLINTNNPSASLMARIRMVKMDQTTGTGSFAIAGVGGASAGLLALPAPPPGSLSALTGGTGYESQEDRGSFGGSGGISADLSAEALKAIEKLNAPPAMSPPPAMAPPDGEEPDAKRTKIENNDDQNLQDEALKAIHALNGS